MPRSVAQRAAAVLSALVLGLALTGCSTIDSVFGSLGPAPGDIVDPPPKVKGFLGGAAADEPMAALAARRVLAAGGNAADAAVAAGFTLAATLPSRAGLGGGGACLAFRPGRDAPEAILFPPGAGSGAGGDRPAATPLMARGLFLLSARFGSRPVEGLISPAEQLARTGVAASRAFVQDLRVVAGPLGGDPVAASIFLPGGRPLAEGQTFVQPDLAATLAQLRTSGVGDLYQGALARRFAADATAAGGALTAADLRAALPAAAAPLQVRMGDDNAWFLPPPADGGLAAGVAFRSLMANQPVDTARALALGAATRIRAQGGDPAAILNDAAQPAPALPPLPASAGLATLDKDGNAVVCAFTMNNLFGTGRIAGRTGILLAASPRSTPAPLLAAGMVTNTHLKVFRAEAVGTGQDGAPLAAAAALANAVRSGRAMPAAVPDPGRADAITCARYLPGDESSCSWAVDPRGAGIAVGSN